LWELQVALGVWVETLARLRRCNPHLRTDPSQILLRLHTGRLHPDFFQIEGGLRLQQRAFGDEAVLAIASSQQALEQSGDVELVVVDHLCRRNSLRIHRLSSLGSDEDFRC
jgi:hypothetical protein